MDTVRRWIRDGVRARRAADEGIAVPANRTAMAEFSVAIQKAKARARKNALEFIKGAMSGQWQAAAWYLERTSPADYGRSTRTEISGPDAGPIQVASGSIGDAIKAALAATPEIVVRGDDEG